MVFVMDFSFVDTILHLPFCQSKVIFIASLDCWQTGVFPTHGMIAKMVFKNSNAGLLAGIC